jgi:hypothetical protein
LSISVISQQGIISLVRKYFDTIIFSIFYESLLDESPFANLFKQHITHLNVSIDNSKLKLLLVDDNENLYAFISSIFTNLTDFSFTCHGLWRRYAHLTIDDSCHTNSFFQNIINLRIDVDTLDDCLRLLDGRLIYLRKFVVSIYKIESSTFDADSKVKIWNRNVCLSFYLNITIEDIN